MPQKIITIGQSRSHMVQTVQGLGFYVCTFPYWVDRTIGLYAGRKGRGGEWGEEVGTERGGKRIKK